MAELKDHSRDMPKNIEETIAYWELVLKNVSKPHGTVSADLSSDEVTIIKHIAWLKERL